MITCSEKQVLLEPLTVTKNSMQFEHLECKGSQSDEDTWYKKNKKINNGPQIFEINSLLFHLQITKKYLLEKYLPFGKNDTVYIAFTVVSHGTIN